MRQDTVHKAVYAAPGFVFSRSVRLRFGDHPFADDRAFVIGIGAGLAEDGNEFRKIDEFSPCLELVGQSRRHERGHGIDFANFVHRSLAFLPAERRVSNDDFLVALVNDRPHEDGTVVERDELVLVVLGDGLVGFENGFHGVGRYPQQSLPQPGLVRFSVRRFRLHGNSAQGESLTPIDEFASNRVTKAIHLGGQSLSVFFKKDGSQ